MLHMSIEFMEDALIWDAAHLPELVYDDVKNGKKDHGGNFLPRRLQILNSNSSEYHDKL